jgi:glycosyltransferase involved in cell wall biosynthesis
MRILVSNYRYFISGGPERYMFNATRALEERGHDIIPFSIRYTKNKRTEYEKYFVDPLSSPDEIYFKEQKKSIRATLKTLNRLFYATDVENAVKKIIQESKPEIAYVLHYLRKLSPSLLVGIKKCNLSIVVRISDYAMLCPQAHCLRNQLPCEKCITGNLWPSIKYGCVQKSKIASALNALATYYYRHKRFFDLIDAFVLTNEFMFDMMVKAGYPKNKLHCIPTFTDIELFKPEKGKKKEVVSYVGRLENIKGVHVFLDAVGILHQKRPGLLKQAIVVGNGEDIYFKRLKAIVEKNEIQELVTFAGELDSTGINKILGESLVSIVPSIWYENMPNSILESFACGVPVLASGIGSLTSLVQNGVTGFLFPPGDSNSLAERIVFCLENIEKTNQMGINARKKAETIYSSESHILKLEKLFEKLLKREI